MPLYNPPSVNNTELENRIGSTTSPAAGSLNEQVAGILLRFGLLADAASPTGGLLARLAAIASFVDDLENRVGDPAAPGTTSLIGRLQTLLTNFGAIADASANATGSLMARLRNIGDILGTIADASSTTGSLMARLRSIATDASSLVAAGTHPSTGTRTPYTFVANTAQTIATAAAGGVRYRTVSVRSPKSNSVSVFIGIGSATATVADATVELEPGGFYETYHTGVISAISTGTPTILVTTQQ